VAFKQAKAEDNARCLTRVLPASYLRYCAQGLFNLGQVGFSIIHRTDKFVYNGKFICYILDIQ